MPIPQMAGPFNGSTQTQFVAFVLTFSLRQATSRRLPSISRNRFLRALFRGLAHGAARRTRCHVPSHCFGPLGNRPDGSDRHGSTRNRESWALGHCDGFCRDCHRHRSTTPASGEMGCGNSHSHALRCISGKREGRTGTLDHYPKVGLVRRPAPRPAIGFYRSVNRSCLE